jgi:hypothetical protein
MSVPDNPRTWWYWELLAWERTYAADAMQVVEIRAELKRRNELYRMVAVWIVIVPLILGAFWEMFSK